MLYIIYIIFIILGLLFLFFPKTVKSNKSKIKLDRLIKQDCFNKKVKCIDSCNFLCSEDTYDCINNICQIRGTKSIKCDKEKGGIVVLTHFNFMPYWECLCTRPDFFGGPDCSQKRFDVCNKGIFSFDLSKSSCKCNSPNILIHLNNKPYCIDSQYKKFFPENV